MFGQPGKVSGGSREGSRRGKESAGNVKRRSDLMRGTR